MNRFEFTFNFGEWTTNPDILLFNIHLSKTEYELFKDPKNIKLNSIYEIKNELWIDISDVYLVFESEKIIIKKMKEKNFV
jgi:hypothetical protein